MGHSPFVVQRPLHEGRRTVLHLAARATGGTVALEVAREDAPACALAISRKALAHTLAAGVGLGRLLEVTEHDELPALAYEPFRGRTLGGLLAARPKLDPQMVLKLGREAAQVLTRLHEQGVLHTQLDPSAIFVTTDPVFAVRLTSLGDARFSHERTLQAEDVRALAAVLFECATGTHPTGPMTTESALQDLAQAKAGLTIEVAHILASALGQGLGDRGAAELHAAFASASEHGPVSVVAAPPTTRAMGSAAIPPPPSGASAASRRRHMRAPYVAPTRVVPLGEPAIDGRLEEISSGGAQLILAKSCADGSSVRVRFARPLHGTVVEVLAIVRWSRPARTGHAVGVEFGDLDFTVVEEIERYVAMVTG